ncbi:EamA family transporter [Roseburia sp. MSJ-14]|uniref:EamA family transporter n=1 Tax=Roseburia sp. MSJ-14 TaxID=2841514 RepID=UPI001C115068|nr:EamA family transporter [Roseburia sp. MSJ-14]MBU5473731.1 EamA family transporter [Roseburia sp. MSJ-14]
MWILFATGSALFAGATAILAKIGVKNTDSDVATALRTIVVLLFSWLMVFVTNSYVPIDEVTQKTLWLLVLSGVATGASWLCYFKALQLGDVNKVTPIDKTSTVLTMILAFLFLGEAFTVPMFIGMVGILAGTMLMIEKKETVVTQQQKKDYRWLIYAILSVVFASATSILGKLGMEGIPSNYGTAVRTGVVLVMAWVVVFLQKKQSKVKGVGRTSWIFLILSGVTTGMSWLCYYRALQEGPASIVVPIDKLSILITILFARVFLKERLTKKAVVGLVLLVAGTLVLLL